MRKSVNLVVLVSILAGCAAPLPTRAPSTAVAPQAAAQKAPVYSPEVTVPVVATGVQQTAPTKQAAAATKPTKVEVTKVEAEGVKTPAALTLPKVTSADKGLTSLDDFQPMTALSQLGKTYEATTPDDPDDDSDDDEGSFSVKWLWGWWGLDGRDRGLRTFAKEEGRAVEWLVYPDGWTCMRAVLLPEEEPGAVALAMSPLYSRTPIDYKFLPKVLQSHSKRHLKFFRRQDVVNLKSKHLGFYQVKLIGTTAIAGYIARAENGGEAYIGYYDASGRFLWAYGTPWSGGYTGYALPEASPSPAAQ